MKISRMTTSTKICPKCDTEHTKPGKFCSRKCANSRQWTDEHKKKFSVAQANYMASERAEDHKAKRALQMQLLHTAGLLNNDPLVRQSIDRDEVLTNPDDYFFAPPEPDDVSSFVQDGDYWEEI